jgi:hypothetical protein
MIETSKLALEDDGAVAMGPNGTWLAGSRLGLAFSKVQLRDKPVYDPNKDLWIDPDASKEAAGSGLAATVTQAISDYNENVAESDTMIKAVKVAVNDGDTTKENEAYDEHPKGKEIAKKIYEMRSYFRGPPAGAALHETVVGAWHVGTVLDTAASRGAGRGFASHKYDSAVNVNVDIQWWSGDRLFKNYANKPGTGQDFRMRAMPVMGYTDNGTEGSKKPSVFDVRENVHADGSIVGSGAAQEALDAYLLMEQGLPDPPDEAVIKANAKTILAARTTFPDPWDLPAAVKMLPSMNSMDIYNLDRKEYVGVGQQRGVWARTSTSTLKVRVGRDETGEVKDNYVMDPGNKFASGARTELTGTEFESDEVNTFRQGAIVAHVSN